MYCETQKRKKSLPFSNLELYAKSYASAGFSLDFLERGGGNLFPHMGEGTSTRGQSVNGGYS